MLHRRVAYAAALAAALLFQIFFKGWFSAFLLALVVLFPVLALALSLPAILSCALELSPCVPAVERGGAARFQVRLRNPAGLPLSLLRVRLSYVNQLTGQTETLRREVRGASRGAAFSLDADAAHCGRLVCTVTRLSICDLLGLCSLPRPVSGQAELLVLPVPASLEIPPELTGEQDRGKRLRPRPGGGPGEDYDLRAYRPGDPMKSVHWKLSTKRDELVVREVLEPCRAELILSFDHFGTPETLDAVLDRLCALSRALLERERPHRIQWADPVSGAVEDHSVEDAQGLRAALAAACSAPAPETGRSILDGALCVQSAGGRHIHVTAHGLKGGAAV